MSAKYLIFYHPDVVKKDIPHLAHLIRQRIKDTIEEKLLRYPGEFGEPLRRTLKGYWKLRVGDYRVIYKVTGKTILVLRIGHRSEIYQM